jgi:uncharacterized protein YukE
MAHQAIVSPEALERFASSVRQFNAQLLESMARLEGQFQALGDTWRDQEHSRFAAEFEQTMQVLQQFTKSLDEQIPFLLRKAQKAHEYLAQR